MWVNAALTWGIYLLCLTARNLSWAHTNRQPWLRHSAPLASLLVVVVGSIAVMTVADHIDTTSTNQFGVTGQSRQPAPALHKSTCT